MEDNEIIKALECCYEFQCDECPLDPHSIDPVICERRCKQESLNLINRQKAGIERLKQSRDRWRQIAEAFDRSTREEEKAGETE